MESYGRVVVGPKGSRSWSPFWAVCIGVLAVMYPLQDGDFQHRSLVTVPYLAAVSVLTLWALGRGVRVSMVADANGLLVRNPFRTYSLSWQDITEFRDGSLSRGNEGDVWAMVVVSMRGQTIPAHASAKRFSDPDISAVTDVARDAGVTVHLTGSTKKRSYSSQRD